MLFLGRELQSHDFRKGDLKRYILGHGFITMEILKERFQKKWSCKRCGPYLGHGFTAMEISKERFQKKWSNKRCDPYLGHGFIAMESLIKGNISEKK